VSGWSWPDTLCLAVIAAASLMMVDGMRRIANVPPVVRCECLE
jgi:hypothetical protein